MQERLVGFGSHLRPPLSRNALGCVGAYGLEGQRLGQRLVEALLHSSLMADAEQVYLMHTNNAEFYAWLHFQEVRIQRSIRLQ